MKRIQSRGRRKQTFPERVFLKWLESCQPRTTATICERLENAETFDYSRRAVLAVLRRLYRAELIDWRYTTSGAPPKLVPEAVARHGRMVRVYHVTPAGQRAIGSQRPAYAGRDRELERREARDRKSLAFAE